MSKSRNAKKDDLSRSQLEKLIEEWIIGDHGERNRAILRRRLFDGITFDDLAEEFDMSVRQIKTVVYKGEDKIFNRV